MGETQPDDSVPCAAVVRVSSLTLLMCHATEAADSDLPFHPTHPAFESHSLTHSTDLTHTSFGMKLILLLSKKYGFPTRPARWFLVNSGASELLGVFNSPLTVFFTKVIISFRSPKRWAAQTLMRRARRHLLPRLDVCFVDFNKPEKQAEGEEFMWMFVHLKKIGPKQVPCDHNVTIELHTDPGSCCVDCVMPHLEQGHQHLVLLDRHPTGFLTNQV